MFYKSLPSASIDRTNTADVQIQPPTRTQKQLRFTLPIHIHKERGVWNMCCEMWKHMMNSSASPSFIASGKSNARDICVLYNLTWKASERRKNTQSDCIVFQYGVSWKQVILCSISICMCCASGRSDRQCFLEHNTSRKAEIVLRKCCLQKPHWASPLQAMNNLVTKWRVSEPRCLPFHLWEVYTNQTAK